jgi:hypothetical protein
MSHERSLVRCLEMTVLNGQTMCPSSPMKSTTNMLETLWDSQIIITVAIFNDASMTAN